MADPLFEELNQLATTLLSPAGTILFRRDQPSSSVYLVRKGNMALLWPDAEETFPMELRGPGNIIGLPAVLNGSYCSASKSMTDSELGVIRSDRVIELLEFKPALCRIAIQLMGKEIATVRSALIHRCGQSHRSDDRRQRSLPMSPSLFNSGRESIREEG